MLAINGYLKISSSNRFTYLDSTRGIAALIVLLAHYQLTILPQLNNSWVLKSPFALLVDGKAAILYFFVLSGFVLTLSLRNTELSIPGYWKFIVSRFFRIYPAYLFTLILTFFVISNVNIRTSTWLDQYWGDNTNIISFLKQSVLIVRSPYEPIHRLIPHDWTLTIEISLSLILPVIAAYSRTYMPWMLIMIYLSIKFLGLDPFIFDFSIGVYMASNKDFLIKRWTSSRYKIPMLIAAIFLITSDYIFPEWMRRMDVLLIHHKTWGLSIILIWILSSTKVQLLLDLKIFQYIGRISYSFYLLHLVVLLCMTILLPSLNPFLFLLLLILIVVTVSTISFFLIEKPFIRLGKKITGKAKLKSTN